MPEAPLLITNRQARELWLDRQGLAGAPCGKRHNAAFSDRVQSLGMVQLDSIGILARAHHHILWSRQSAYRQPVYNRLLQQERLVFEHFSHDAVILPMSTYPYWRRQQQRRAQRYQRSDWGRSMADRRIRAKLLTTIERHGPVCSRDLAAHASQPADKSRHAWMRPEHKLALDYLWLEGTLSVSHRDDFIKYYDLSERIIPKHYRDRQIDEQEQVNWLCEQALLRLGFASAMEIQRFWDACDLAEVQAWLQQPSIPIMSIEYADVQGRHISAFAPAQLESELVNCSPCSGRVRIVSPFDPAVRDRNRLSRLFGFDYRIEIYVPADRRRYGYYVYPMLQGNRMIGRIDVRANRQADRLEIRAWWLEPGVRDTAVRRTGIEKELLRLARLADVSQTGELPAPSAHPDGTST